MIRPDAIGHQQAVRLVELFRRFPVQDLTSGIVHRPSQDLDFATRNDTPLLEIAAHVRDAFQRAGYSVRLAEAASLRCARLVLQLPGSGGELELDLLKEALEPRWVTVQITPGACVRAVSLEDTVGLKARAWHDRFVIRDIIDLHARSWDLLLFRS